jgi:hypothetical protein
MASGDLVLYSGGSFPAVALGSNTNIFWETGTTVAGSRNVGLVKAASGQIVINDGFNASTNWRDLILRNLTASGRVTAAGNAVVHQGLRLLNDSTTIGSSSSIAFERTDTPGTGVEIRGATYGGSGLTFVSGGNAYARHQPSLLELTSSTSLNWASAGTSSLTSTFMFRPAQNTLALRGGTGASIWYVYGTTDTTNYTRAAIGAAATAVNLSAESAGTASANLDVVLTPKGTGVVSVAGNLTASGDIEITDPTRGIILRSPNGTRWRIQVTNAGTLTTSSL